MVTGAAGGIGLALAGRLRRAGASVVLADLPGPALDRAATEVGGTAVPTDVSDADGSGRSPRWPAMSTWSA